jgi:hypothetical protein
MKRFAVATLALGAALALGASAAPATGLQVAANGPDGGPPVWWQFVTNGPNGERQVSPHFPTEADCERALKTVEAILTKKFPNRYPLVGSCESYR